MWRLVRAALQELGTHLNVLAVGEAQRPGLLLGGLAVRRPREPLAASHLVPSATHLPRHPRRPRDGPAAPGRRRVRPARPARRNAEPAGGAGGSPPRRPARQAGAPGMQRALHLPELRERPCTALVRPDRSTRPPGAPAATRRRLRVRSRPPRAARRAAGKGCAPAVELLRVPTPRARASAGRRPARAARP